MSQPSTPAAGEQGAVRTDDLLASGAEPENGARGYHRNADPQTLQTGMEGIAGTTAGQNAKQTGSGKSGISETVQDHPAEVRPK